MKPVARPVKAGVRREALKAALFRRVTEAIVANIYRLRLHEEELLKRWFEVSDGWERMERK